MTAEQAAVSILVAKDAGRAGRTLLGRKEVRVRWALTAAEAQAVIKLTKCSVCITRESLARPVLEACADVDRKVATIVLLEPARAAQWREYFNAGAASVLQVDAADQLLEAMSDATGVSFRTAQRIPFKTEVTFALGDEGGAWQSLTMSSTGICIFDFPPYELGSEVDLAFEISNKRYEFNAVVTEVLRVNARRAVGLGFRDLTPELQAAIDDVIRSASGGDARFGDPLDGFDELDDMTMMSLRNTTTQISHDARDLVEALASGGKIEQSETTSRWLAAACEGFSKFELLAIREPQRAPAWAHDAVLARLHVYQVRASAGSETVPDAAVHEILGLCQRLAVTAAGAEASSLVQVANIRADILRALYDPDLFDDESF